MKNLLKIIAATLTLTTLLAGCASTAETATTETATAETGTTETATAEATTEERPYYVADPSEVTGEIVVFNTLLESQQEALLELWDKYYPDCKIEFQTDSIGVLATRIRSNEDSDVDVVCGGFFATDGTSYQDILQPYTAACSDEQLFTDPDGYYTYFDTQVMVLVVNNQALADLGISVEGYADLLQPELAGKIITADPSASSSGYRHLQTVLALMGDSFADEKSWAYVDQLADASYATTSSSDVYNLVQTGEYVVGLSYESAVQSIISDGADVSCIYMSEGNTAVAGGAGIVKNSPNLAASQAFVDLMSSAEWQSIRNEVSQARGSNELATVMGLPETTSLGLVDLDYGYLKDNKDQLIEDWNGYFVD